MGFAAGGFCHATKEAAAAYDCGTNYPAVWGSGDSLVVTSCTAWSDAGLSLSKSLDGGPALPFGVVVTYPECSPTEWMTYHPFSLSIGDGAALVAGVCAVWFAAAAYRFARKALGDHNE